MKFPCASFRPLHRLALPTALALLLAGCPGSTSVTTHTESSADGATTTIVTSGVSYSYSSGFSTSPAVAGSGKSATENRPIAAFSKIKVEGAVVIDAALGPATVLTITTDDNLLPIFETKIEGDTLHIHPTSNYNTKLGVRVKITTPTLNAVTAAGACNVQAHDLDTPTFALDISGTSSAQLAGKAETLQIQISGAGNLKATDFPAQNVKIDISGTGAAKVCATAALDATISGAGSVRYSGHPAQVKKNVSGVGSIQEE